MTLAMKLADIRTMKSPIFTLAVVIMAGCAAAHGRNERNVTPATESTSSPSSWDKGQALAARIQHLSKSATFHSPNQPACPELQAASTEACSLGIKSCSEQPSDCRPGARLCRLGIGSVFAICTTGYQVGDQRDGGFDTGAPIGMPPVNSQVVPLLETGCTQGDRDICAFVGWLYDRGIGVTRDGARRVAFLITACSGGSAEGCYELGMAYYLGRDVTRDLVRAVVLFRQACESDSSQCAALAAAYVDGKGVDRNPEVALELLTRACSAGDRSSCPMRDCLAARRSDVPSMLQLFECAGFH
jgi:hypothetical protein